MSLPPRVIPVLLLDNGYAVKTLKFSKPRYIGDPINAVKLFNDKQVDELIVCDIRASRDRQLPDYATLEAIASEAFMPVGFAGNISALTSALRVLDLGVEKIVLNSALRSHPDAVAEIADTVGSQSVVASIDVKRSALGRYSVYTDSGKVPTGATPTDWARRAVGLGAGEIIVNSIDRDGTRSGYDVELIGRVAGSIDVPVVALGGAGGVEDLRLAISAGASAVAAGSMFVFHGRHQAVLITYPARSVIEALFKDA